MQIKLFADVTPTILLVYLIFFYACSNPEYYSAGDFVSIKKIDAHTHPKTENTALVGQAKADNSYHTYNHPENPSYVELIAARDRFLEKHADLRFVGAHLGSLEWSVDELAKRLDRFPNMAVDMAARISHLQYQSRMDREKVRNFLTRYKERIVYATDAGISEDADPEVTRQNLHNRWIANWEYLVTDEMMSSPHVNGEIQGLKLPRDVVDHIYYKNAVKWFKIPQR